MVNRAISNAAERNGRPKARKDITPFQVQGMMMTAETPLWSSTEKKLHVGRAFLDSGAQRNFISQAFAKKAGLKAHRRQRVNIVGFGDKPTDFMANHYMVNLAILPTSDSQTLRTLEFEVIEMPLIVGELLCMMPEISLAELNTPVLPARHFNVQKPDMLLGIDVYTKLIKQQITELPSGFAMYHSLLGPIVCGQGLLDDDPYKKDNKAKTHSAHAGEFSVTVALPIRVTPIGPSKPIKPRTSVTLQAPYKVPTFVRRELEALASSSQASSTFVRREPGAPLLPNNRINDVYSSSRNINSRQLSRFKFGLGPQPWRPRKEGA
jgi:hypothetical protein